MTKTEQHKLFYEIFKESKTKQDEFEALDKYNEAILNNYAQEYQELANKYINRAEKYNDLVDKYIELKENNIKEVQLSLTPTEIIQGHKEPSKAFKGYKETVLDLYIPQSELETFCKMKTLEIKGKNQNGDYKVNIEVVEDIQMIKKCQWRKSDEYDKSDSIDATIEELFRVFKNTEEEKLFNRCYNCINYHKSTDYNDDYDYCTKGLINYDNENPYPVKCEWIESIKSTSK